MFIRKTRDKADVPLLPGDLLEPSTENLASNVLLALYAVAGTGLVAPSR